MIRLISVFLATFTLAFAAQAEPESKATLLTGATLVDVETGTLQSNQSVLVEGDRITFIGPERLAPDGDWSRKDLQGAYLLPGLSDSHVHLTKPASKQGIYRNTMSVPEETIHGVVNARKTLLAGFTTVRNLGAGGYSDIALMDAINAGDVPGPRMLAAGPSIGITGGHCDNTYLPFRFAAKKEGVADGPWAVREKVRQNVKYGATAIKFCGTGGVLSSGTKIGAQQFTLEEMSAIVDEAHMLGVKVAVHAHGPEGIATAIEAGVDSVEHASMITDESIAEAVRRGIWLSMDIYVSDFILSEGEAAGITEESLAKERQVGRVQRERFQAAVEAGANIAFGSDAGVYPHGLNGRQFAKMTAWGMTPMQAIQAATIGNARLFGLEDEIGSIRVGKFADMIAVDENPLENVRTLEDVDFVMKGGVVYLDKLGGNT